MDVAKWAKNSPLCRYRQEREQDVQRWHGRIGDAAAAQAGAVMEYCVVLRGTPLDSSDDAAVHARLSQDEWALELVWSAVQRGVWPGHGQLWLPDPGARVTALDGAADTPDGYLRQRRVQVRTTLERDELAQRLHIAFSHDWLMTADVVDPLQ
jgi:hypothetical protein